MAQAREGPQLSEGWEARTRESYDRVAGAYADVTRDAVAAQVFMSGDYRTLAGLARQTGAQVPLVVDAGCGPGWWAGHLGSFGVRVVGVDLSPVMTALARRNAPDVTSAGFAAGSLLRLPLASRSADAVACLYVLHHLPDDAVEPALGELVRVLRPGGTLLLGGHVGDTSRVKTEGYGHPMLVESNLRPPRFWEGAVRAAGLRIDAHTVYDPDGRSSHALFAQAPHRRRREAPEDRPSGTPLTPTSS